MEVISEMNLFIGFFQVLGGWVVGGNFFCDILFYYFCFDFMIKMICCLVVVCYNFYSMFLSRDQVFCFIEEENSFREVKENFD